MTTTDWRAGIEAEPQSVQAAMVEARDSAAAVEFVPPTLASPGSPWGCSRSIR